MGLSFYYWWGRVDWRRGVAHASLARGRRGRAADGLPPIPEVVSTTLRFLRKSVASVAGRLIGTDLTPKEQISVRIICIYRAGIRQPNWEQT